MKHSKEPKCSLYNFLINNWLNFKDGAYYKSLCSIELYWYTFELFYIKYELYGVKLVHASLSYNLEFSKIDLLSDLRWK